MSNENKEQTVRVYMDMPADLHERYEKALPWGMRSIVLNKVAERIIAGLEKNPVLLGALSSGQFRFEYDERKEE